jgi:uncharacterized membrane protein YsdA (DUF1294 family)
MNLALGIVAWVGAASGAAFVAFGVDKQLARNGGWRISEQTLLLFALAGGTAGAIAGQRWFRHKTQKEPFRSMLYAIAAFQLVVVGVALFRLGLLPLDFLR